jgi:hypothetical protein
MVLHAPQDIVQRADCRDNMRTLVEHYALRAFSHRCVGDLGAGGLTFFGERLQDLRCPDHGQMRRFAEP